jgi:hypothetical protein
MVLNFFNNASEFDSNKPLPPVHLWNPDLCGDIDIKIDLQGQWFHEGSLIKRQKLIDLYSTILKREGDEYFLVTPHEKCRIQVELAPLLVLDWDVDALGQTDQKIKLKTQQGYWFDLNKDHAIRIGRHNNSEYPLAHVRRQLNALLSRNVHYQLAELVEDYDSEKHHSCPVYGVDNQNAKPEGKYFGLYSQHTFFPLVNDA